MKYRHSRQFRAFIAMLAVLHTPALVARPATSTSTASVWLPDGPRLLDQWVEEWDPAAHRWARIDRLSYPQRDTDRHTKQVRAPVTPIARFGPFIVTSVSMAAIIDTTDDDSPRQFERMMSAYPQIRTLSFVDAPGTSNDIANLELGRMIRSSGLETHIPDGGSARSGAVELFLAGARRTMAQSALFAVHSWRDSRGFEPDDYAENDPANRLYIDYYIEMGMTEVEARAFYAMTNSVPHSSALWLGPDQMRHWISWEATSDGQAAKLPVTIAYRFDHMLDFRLLSGG